MTRIRLAGTTAALALAGAVAVAAVVTLQSGPPALAGKATVADHRHDGFGVIGRWLRLTVDEPEEDSRSFENYAQGYGRDEDRGRRPFRDRDWRDRQSGGEDPHAIRRRPEGQRPGGMMLTGPLAFIGMCGPRGDRLVDFTLMRLERITNPTDAQRGAFEKLKDAATRARDTARAGCPAERSMTPPGRMAAAEKRLEAMLVAVRTVRPALDEFFALLNEEQKARIYAAAARPFWREQGRGWRERGGGDDGDPRERSRDRDGRPGGQRDGGGSSAPPWRGRL
jgi:hypothetical protein